MPLVSKSFSDIITFTRASSGTYFDATGTLQTATTNAARFDYNPSTLAARGMLVEEQRTNLLTYSEQLNNAAWTANDVTVSANAAVAPDGASTADLVIPSATSSQFKQLRQNIDATSGVTYTFSQYIKDGGYRYAQIIGVGSVFGTFNFNIDLQTGLETQFNAGTSTVVSRSITAAKNGWYRVSISVTALITSNGARMSADVIPASDSARGVTWSGDGTSGIYFWGAQIEAGAFPTSYISTTTAAATRSADVASVNTLSPWYNSSAGTLYVDAVLARQNALANNKIANLVGSASAEIKIFMRASGATGMSVNDSGGTALADFTGAVIAANGTNKTALAYALNDFAGTTNGASVSTDASGTPPTATSLDIGNSGILCGWIRRITYYPRRLSNVELQGITT